MSTSEMSEERSISGTPRMWTGNDSLHLFPPDAAGRNGDPRTPPPRISSATSPDVSEKMSGRKKWKSVSKLINRRKGWNRSRDAIILVTVKSAKHTRNVNGFPQPGCIRPYVIMKFGEYENATDLFKPDQDPKTVDESWRCPFWDPSSSTFACPFKPNTNLSLILMHEFKGDHLGTGYVTTSFPPFPDGDPPKLDKAIKFVRRLMPLCRGTAIDSSMNKSVALYRERTTSVSSPVSKDPSSSPAAYSSKSMFGKLSFRVTIVQQSTFESILKSMRKQRISSAADDDDANQGRRGTCVLVKLKEATLKPRQWCVTEKVSSTHVRKIVNEAFDGRSRRLKEGDKVLYRSTAPGEAHESNPDDGGSDDNERQREEDANWREAVVCASDAARGLLEVANASDLPRFVPWVERCLYKGYSGTFTGLRSGTIDVNQVRNQPTVSMRSLAGHVFGEVRWSTSKSDSFRNIVFDFPRSKTLPDDHRPHSSLGDDGKWPKRIVLRSMKSNDDVASVASSNEYAAPFALHDRSIVSPDAVNLGVGCMTIDDLPPLNVAKDLTLKLNALTDVDLTAMSTSPEIPSISPPLNRTQEAPIGEELRVRVFVFRPHDVVRSVYRADVQKRAHTRSLSSSSVSAERVVSSSTPSSSSFSPYVPEMSSSQSEQQDMTNLKQRVAFLERQKREELDRIQELHRRMSASAVSEMGQLRDDLRENEAKRHELHIRLVRMENLLKEKNTETEQIRQELNRAKEQATSQSRARRTYESDEDECATDMYTENDDDFDYAQPPRFERPRQRRKAKWRRQKRALESKETRQRRPGTCWSCCTAR